MKKRMLSLLSAMALLLTLTACGGVSGSRLPALETETDSSAVSSGAAGGHQKPTGNYENEDPDGMIGLLTYMEDGKAIVRDTENVKFENGTVVTVGNTTSFVQMSFKEIGAVNGYRYQFTYNGSTVQAEFYRFDPDNLDEKGKTCLDSVKEKGFFELLGNTVPATLHPSGKYLMIYTDAKEDEKNEAQKKWAEELFLSFPA